MGTMETWFRLDLGDALLAQTELERLRQALPDVSGHADDWIYVSHEAPGSLHCHLIVWFPPAAAGLGRRFGAEPSPSPDRNGLERLAAVCCAADSPDPSA